MGFLDRLFGRKKPRRRDDKYYDDRYDEQGAEDYPYEERYEEEEHEASSLLVDHRLEFVPGEDYERNLANMIYMVEIENNTDYPMGNIRAEFPKSMKLGGFEKPESDSKMLDPGEKMMIKVPFKGSYIGGKDTFEFEIVFFDFKYKVEEKVVLSSEPIKIVVPKFKPEELDEDSYRFLTADLFRWSVETAVVDIPAKELYSSLKERMEGIGFNVCNEMINENMYRGISQLGATDKKGRKWASQIQVIGDEKGAKLLLYTYGEKPINAYSLAVKALLKMEKRDEIVENIQ